MYKDEDGIDVMALIADFVNPCRAIIDLAEVARHLAGVRIIVSGR